MDQGRYLLARPGRSAEKGGQRPAVFGFAAEERPADGRVSAEDLAVVSDQGVSPIVVFAADADIANEAAKAHPNTKYVLFEVTGDAPNAAYVSFADEQGAYLAGAIAALKTKSGVIGFIGGVDVDTIHPFESGFVAGARSISPDIRVLSAYLTEPPDFNGFIDAVAAESKATEMYADGADVIFHAAGIAGAGLFEAATHQSTVDRQLWAIGVDSDQYVTVGDREGSVSADAWRPHILTSVLKRWDAAVYGELRDFAQGRLTGGPRIYGLADHGVDISYSGGFINDIADRVETLRARISDGSISVN